MPFIKPNPERMIEGEPLKVFDNVRKDFLPPEGRMVPGSAYWNRMLRHGDVVPVETPEPEPVADAETRAVAKTAKKTTAKTKTDE